MMLKRIIHIALSFVLLVTTIGMVVSKHYCQDDLVSVSLFTDAESCCDMANCCHNETEVFQLKADFSIPVISSIPNQTEHPVFGYDLLVEENFDCSETAFVSHEIIEAPPPPTIRRILTLQQAFLL
ncbi:MAG: hypothetical protein EOM83_07630 [Clostridia bacterium]|nr:hypothetical protein [Clostridia bacterium]